MEENISDNLNDNQIYVILEEGLKSFALIESFVTVPFVKNLVQALKSSKTLLEGIIKCRDIFYKSLGPAFLQKDWETPVFLISLVLGILGLIKFGTMIKAQYVFHYLKAIDKILNSKATRASKEIEILKETLLFCGKFNLPIVFDIIFRILIGAMSKL